MLVIKTEAQKAYSAVRARVFAGMETGNFDAARSALTEYIEYEPESAQSIIADVQTTYGVRL